MRWAEARGQLHPSAVRMAVHLTHRADAAGRVAELGDAMRAYAHHHRLSERTAWADLARLRTTGWVRQTVAPSCCPPPLTDGEVRYWPPAGPGTGRAARYVLTVPPELAAMVEASDDELAALFTAGRKRLAAGWSAVPEVTSDDPSSLEGEDHPPVVPPRRRPRRPARSRPSRGTRSPRKPAVELPVAVRREAAAVLAEAAVAWRHQRPLRSLPTRAERVALLPLVARVVAYLGRPAAVTLLGDRVRSAQQLSSVLGSRMRSALALPPEEAARYRQPRAGRPPRPASRPAPGAGPDRMTGEQVAQVHQRSGPRSAAFRAAFAAGRSAARERHAEDQPAAVASPRPPARVPVGGR